MEIDFNKLRNALIDYFGSATPFFPIAQQDLIYIESCSNEELIKIAINNNIDLDEFILEKPFSFK